MHLVRNCARILVLICSLKRTVFRERSSRKTMSFEGTFIVQGQTYEHNFASDGGYYVYYPMFIILFLQRGGLNVHEKFNFH